MKYRIEHVLNPDLIVLATDEALSEAQVVALRALRGVDAIPTVNSLVSPSHAAQKAGFKFGAQIMVSKAMPLAEAESAVRFVMEPSQMIDARPNACTLEYHPNPTIVDVHLIDPLLGATVRLRALPGVVEVETYSFHRLMVRLSYNKTVIDRTPAPKADVLAPLVAKALGLPYVEPCH